jgi:hypothetical protein
LKKEDEAKQRASRRRKKKRRKASKLVAVSMDRRETEGARFAYRAPPRSPGTPAPTSVNGDD